MVAQVQSGSVAERAGVIVGDFVLKVCGKDVRTADGEQVLRMLREEVGKAVEVAVARPYPVPVTDKEKMRALLVLQTKVSSSSSDVCVFISSLLTQLDSGTIFQPSGESLLPVSVCNAMGSSAVAMYGTAMCLHAKYKMNTYSNGNGELTPCCHVLRQLLPSLLSS